MKKNVKLVKYVLLCAISAGVVSTTLTSCKDYDDDIKNLQEQVSANKTAIDDILAKIKDGDYVQKVEAVENGVKITLGNGTSHTIKNGENGAAGAPGLIGPAGPIGEAGKTPIITINAAGNWAVDGVELTDKDGNPYPSKGEKGNPGENGEDGQPGDPATATSFQIDPETGELIFINGDVKTPTGIYSKMVITENDSAVTITMPNEEGKLTTVTLPKTASAILSVEYRSPFTDDARVQPIYTVKDANSKTILEGATVVDFKVFATNFDQTKAEYFFDLYKLTRSGGPALNIAGTPKYKVAENGKYGVLSFNVKDQNFENGIVYKTALNTYYNGATISSEYFNIQAFNLNNSSLNPLFEKTATPEYEFLTGRTIEFKYTDKLALNDTIALTYNGDQRLNCEGYKAKFTIVEQSESAKFFKLDGDVISLSELGNESSAGIGYTCDMKVQYYAIQENGSEVKLGNEATFKVKAVNQKTPAAVKISEINGTDVITRSWSNLRSQIVKVELHKAGTGLYAQFGGRDNFLSIIGNSANQRLFDVYEKDENNNYSVITTATWTKKGYQSTPSATAQLADSLVITIPQNKIMKGEYYIGEQNNNDRSKITFTRSINTEVTVNLNVDLKSTVIPNQYYVENGSVVIRGEFTAPATVGNDGAHEMTADLSKVFLANPNLDLTFKFAETQDKAIKTLITAGQLRLNGKDITLSKGIANLNLATLPKVNITITATGYNYSETGEGSLSGANATVSFKSPIDAATLKLASGSKTETADNVEFDLSKIITELKDVKGHLLIKDSEIVLTTATVNGWAPAFNIGIPAITNASIIADTDAKQAFTIVGKKLIYDNSAITLTKDLSVKVKVVVTSFWGPVTGEATFTVKKK